MNGTLPRLVIPHSITNRDKPYYLSGKTVRDFLASEGIYPEQLATPGESYKELVKHEAARIAEEERQEALEAENARGLWGQLSSGGE